MSIADKSFAAAVVHIALADDEELAALEREIAAERANRFHSRARHLLIRLRPEQRATITIGELRALFDALRYEPEADPAALLDHDREALRAEALRA